ncbi:hypothetical protein FOA52_002303 [Chlamydomonas sp. UWO 241]|nr:hypothetical protein FOA52_002303 [Chlamydomonas sp. UWO 241]
MCGGDVPLTPRWRVEMYRESGLAKRATPDSYRDAPCTEADEDALREAGEELMTLQARCEAERPGWHAAAPVSV